MLLKSSAFSWASAGPTEPLEFDEPYCLVQWDVESARSKDDGFSEYIEQILIEDGTDPPSWDSIIDPPYEESYVDDPHWED